MARITRSSIIQKLQDLLGIQTGTDVVATDSSNVVQPVVDIGPNTTTIWKVTSATTTSSVTVYTTPSDKDFYLTYAFLSMTKDATSDNILTNATIVVGGVTLNILAIPSQTTTAWSDQVCVSFPYPIKLDRASIIVLAGTFSAGTMSKRLLIGGYLLE